MLRSISINTNIDSAIAKTTNAINAPKIIEIKAKIALTFPRTKTTIIVATIINQPQSVEASHLFIFAAQINIGEEDVQKHAERTAATRNQDIRELDKFVQGVSGYLQGQTEEERLNWAHKQSYIALGLVMAEAARAGIDTTPMEGFKHDELDAYLKLNEQGYASSVILAAGFRDSENDFLANLAKVRKTQNEIIVFI